MSRERQVDQVIDADVVLIGAGAAGLSAAARLAGRARVDLVSREGPGQGGASPLAQGGLAAATAAADSPLEHATDTLTVAAELADHDAVTALTGDAPAQIALLRRLGARFDTAADGSLALAREAGHRQARVVHVGDATGREVVRVLAAAAEAAETVRLHPASTARQLVVDADRVTGVIAERMDGALVYHRAPATILATGGVGGLYARTTNPPGATGDGLVLAAAAGARLTDLEFVQFHPTALAVAADPLPLLTEALRGAGARLLDQDGRRFLLPVHPDAELAPRDVVARALHALHEAGGTAFLDLRGIVDLDRRFPTVTDRCAAYGVDPTRTPVPVTPAAHYHMGGIAVDLRGRTSRPGLWAIGEVACTGAHGANRLASNSLVEALVFGARAAEDIATTQLPTAGTVRPPTWQVDREPVDPALLVELRRRMWSGVGLVRDDAGLRATLRWLHRSDNPEAPGRPAPLVAAELIATAALARRESRGGHVRSDYPYSRPGWRRHVVVEPGHLDRFPVGAHL